MDGDIMQILYGKEVENHISETIREKLDLLREKNKVPKLAILRVGNNGNDISYEKSLRKKLDSFQIPYVALEYPENIEVNAFKNEIKKLNNNNEIDAIMLFRPLPVHLERENVTEVILPDKDIDCATLYNQGKLFAKDDCLYYPCTPMAVLDILKFYKIDIVSKNIVIAGASQVVGKPLSMMFAKEKATVTICNSKTVDMHKLTVNADIIISAIGKPKYLTKDYFSDGQTIIDVGINFDENGKICGDVDFENIDYENIKITPVPNGVGVITTTILVKQLVEKYFKLS